jgi:hypothetical protein
MREEVFSSQTLIDHAVVRKWRGGFAGVECGRVHKKGSGTQKGVRSLLFGITRC